MISENIGALLQNSQMKGYDEYWSLDQTWAAEIGSAVEEATVAGQNRENHGGAPWPAMELGGKTQKRPYGAWFSMEKTRKDRGGDGELTVKDCGGVDLGTADGSSAARTVRRQRRRRRQRREKEEKNIIYYTRDFSN